MEFEIKDYTAMQRAITDFCRFLGENGVSSDRVFDSRLALNELLGNALKYAGGTARLQATLHSEYIEITVLSKTAFIPPKKSRCSDVYAEHGRGLFLVDSVCFERSVSPDGGIQIKIKIQ